MTHVNPIIPFNGALDNEAGRVIARQVFGPHPFSGMSEDESGRVIMRQVFGPRRLRPFDPAAGSGVIITLDAMGAIISTTASTPDDANVLNASQVFRRHAASSIPGTLTITTINRPGELHTHAITASSNPGIASAILSTSSAGALTLTSDASAVTVTLTRDYTTDNNSDRTVMTIKRDYSSGAGAAGIGVAVTFATKGASALVNSGQIRNVLTTVTAGSEVSDIRFSTFLAGTLANRMTIGDTVTVVNNFVVSGTTDSTSKDTGTIVTEGGLGVEKAATIGTVLGIGTPPNSARAIVAVNDTVAASLIVLDAGTTNVVDTLLIQHQSSGTPAAGFGLNLRRQMHSSNNTLRNVVQEQTTWLVATDASRTVRHTVYIYDTVAREAYHIDSTGTAVELTLASDVKLTTTIVTYNNVATEGYGVPAIVDDVALADQGADIGSTNFANAGTVGTYQINVYFYTSVQAAGTGTVTLTIAWNDGTAARTNTFTTSLTTTGSFKTGVLHVRLGSGSVSYSTSNSGSYSTAKYSLYMTVERLS